MRTGNNDTNGHVVSEHYNGVRLVYAPKLKWYQFGVPYSSELERLLGPTLNHEEQAVIVAPDKATRIFLRMESLPSHIPIIIGKDEARRTIDMQHPL